MSDIHLYTTQTPNGVKIPILLEELGLSYKVTDIDIATNVQREPWFLEINPNGRIPALTDTFTDGKPIRLFESGSIMQYLTDRYDTEYKVSYPRGSREYYEVNNWLMWQMGGLGPMQGQLNHFIRYAPEKVEYSIKRYKKEVRHLYRTLETQLESSTSGYLVGDRCTSADIACWGWVATAKWGRINMEEFPALQEWVERMLKRPGVEKGRHVPSPHVYETYQILSDEEMDQRAARLRDWVKSSMNEEAK
ncbi:glutathione S-transferase [Daldinia caldariorum]|uniref:glutathione S-transferase n=1 Tax=Daldinia caldariorum TaxID=326644 RepID=UPI0020084F38|nr:glutathione S-transferase [Daldinia caldariorum]KAI1464507.1 glutathione S-transferase [Daldinia caldariorum]